MKRLNYKGFRIEERRVKGADCRFWVVKDGAGFPTLEQAQGYIDLAIKFANK